MMDKRPVRVRSFGHGNDSFEPLGADCDLVTIGQPLEAADLEKVASLLHDRPDVTLRLHTRASGDLDILRYFAGVRRLSVDLWQLEDIGGLSHLQAGLEHLHFGGTRKRFSLRFLDAMPALRELSLVGHSKDIGRVGGLAQLTTLGFRGVTLPDLSLLTSLPGLAHFSLLLGGTTNLSHLAELPRLQTLNVMRVTKLADLSILAKLASLRTLSLDWIRNVTSLPSLALLACLEDVTLETMKGLAGIAAVAAAPALRRLTVTGMPQLGAEAFHCLIGHPRLAELHLYPSLGGVGLKKPVLEAVRQLLPGIVPP